MNFRHVVAALVGVAFAVVVPASAAWADYPPSAPTVQLLVTTGTCSDTIGVTGSNWKPGSTVTLELHSTPVNVGSAVANGSGAFSTTFGVPKDAELGNHQLFAFGFANDGSAVNAFTNMVINGTNCSSTPNANQTTTTTARGATTTTVAGGTSSTTASVLGNTLVPTGLQTPNVGAAPQAGPASSPNNAPAAVGSAPGTGAATQTSPSHLPLTGAAAVGLMLIVGLGLIAIGSMSVLVARRQHQS